MLFVSHFGKIPELLDSGFAPTEMVSIVRRPPRNVLPKGAMENRGLAPVEILTYNLAVGAIDEFTARVMYYDYLTMFISPRHLQKIIDFRNYRVFLTEHHSAWQREVFAKWLSSHGIPCEEWVLTIEIDLFRYLT